MSNFSMVSARPPAVIIVGNNGIGPGQASDAGDLDGILGFVIVSGPVVDPTRLSPRPLAGRWTGDPVRQDRCGAGQTFSSSGVPYPGQRPHRAADVYPDVEPRLSSSTLRRRVRRVLHFSPLVISSRSTGVISRKSLDSGWGGRSAGADGRILVGQGARMKNSMDWRNLFS